MKKVVYVLNIDNYFPKLCKITLPNLRSYAKRIGAKLVQITKRKFPDYPVTYEKMQIHQLGKDNDWSILIDADFLINPRFHDITSVLPKDHVGVYMGFDANRVFLNLDKDKYFLRDERNMGLVTSFLVTHKWCHDLWEPLDISLKKALGFLPRPHIVDELCVSRNMAKYRLKRSGLVPDAFNSDLVIHLDAITKDGDEDRLVSQAGIATRRWNGQN